MQQRLFAERSVAVVNQHIAVNAIPDGLQDGQLVAEADSRHAASSASPSIVGGWLAGIAGSGSTVTAQSGWQLDSSTVATSALQMRIIQGLQEVDNTIGSANAKWLTTINFGIHPWTITTGI